MTQKIAKTYVLQCDDPVMDGRPCWIQKVRKEKDLYILAQACKPEEQGFPHVETMLAVVTREGEILEYGSNEILGIIGSVTLADDQTRRTIEWIDGTGVTWIETP